MVFAVNFSGDDPESSRLTGINVNRVLVSVYAVAGFIYAIGAWFLMGRIGAASPQSGIGANLKVPTDGESTAAWLFGEDQGRYLLAVAPERLDEVIGEIAMGRSILER